ncbi:amidohydrolase [Niabella ginsenosidivorans]|uniref:Omega-amidase YafV n=1 Tax=Niabella ginsenosidivorans TaxID=1176587 RepID=A0A1A9I905_9BACT|nr:amidohydrolase [Niabella ginsenosidivorans]ANH83004.1 amidohydrolase [Niabella ginsenosidivorans]
MSLQISIIQTPLYWEDKTANLEMLQQKIESISQTQVVILPEMFSTGFSMKPELLAETMDGPTVQWMKDIAAKKKIILTGSIIIEEDGHYYNRLIWMLPTRQYGSYDKRHLFAFAKEDEHYTAGNKRFIASVNGWKINLQVCYDLRFPVWARQNALFPQEQSSGPAAPEYDVLINVANWPRRRSLAWKTLLQARAIENQCYVAGVNRVGEDGNHIDYSGDSMVIDPLGRILYHQADAEDLFTITLSREKLQEVREQFPFWKDGDAFTLY